jgi:regulator of protease activity HflC (stomatin/prohibitin superfamily)
MSHEAKITLAAIGTLTISIVIIGFLFWFFPTYNVWAKQQSGKAQLSEAEFNRQIAIREAEARLESEKLNAQSEVERAKGAAEAISIEAGQLTENYIRYLWIRNLETGEKQLIYVPTEAGLPILEANRQP